MLYASSYSPYIVYLSYDAPNTRTNKQLRWDKSRNRLKVLVVKPAGHRQHAVTAGGRNYKLDANVDWISVGSIMMSVWVIPDSWLLWYHGSNVVKVHRLLRHRNAGQHVSVLHKWTVFIENNMLVCKPSCLWKTVFYVFLRSVAVLLWTLNTKVQLCRFGKTVVKIWLKHFLYLGWRKPTRCNLCRYLFTAKLLYMFRAYVAPIISKVTFEGACSPYSMICTRGCNYSFMYSWW